MWNVSFTSQLRWGKKNQWPMSVDTERKRKKERLRGWKCRKKGISPPQNVMRGMKRKNEMRMRVKVGGKVYSSYFTGNSFTSFCDWVNFPFLSSPPPHTDHVFVCVCVSRVTLCLCICFFVTDCMCVCESRSPVFELIRMKEWIRLYPSPFSHFCLCSFLTQLVCHFRYFLTDHRITRQGQSW